MSKGAVAIAVLLPGQGTQTPRMGAPWRTALVWEIVESTERPIAAGQAVHRGTAGLEAVTRGASEETPVGMGRTTLYQVGAGNVLTGLAKRAVNVRSVAVPTDALVLEVA
jgi:hypothetical protein